jgi:folate-dependent phosphoribosylglycinamide formyltransferase PurN
MRIAITSGSDFNPYAATLVCSLTAAQLKPTALVLVKPPLVGRVITQVKCRGLKTTLRKAMMRYSGSGSMGSNDWRYLCRFAEQRFWSGWQTTLSELAEMSDMNRSSFETLNCRACADFIRAQKIDLIINAGGGIFRKRIIETPRVGILNAHMGLLPDYRGMNALEWSLLHEDRIGVTVHFIERGIDTGDILLFRELRIERGDSIADLRAKSLPLNVELLTEAIQQLELGRIRRRRQQPEAGRQFFAMHPRLKAIAEAKLQQRGC